MIKVIAELGNAHEGDFNKAIEMLGEAHACGADMVKFQAGTPEGFARSKDQIEFYKKYCFTPEEYYELYKIGVKNKIEVFFSVFSSSKELNKLRTLPYLKIASRQCNREYIKTWQSATTIISIPHTFPVDGLGSLGIEVGQLMHCVSLYPAKDPMLYRIEALKNFYPWATVGYSDHTIGMDACYEAVEKGAEIIEKHFTLDKNTKGLRDHKLSATPDELRKFIIDLNGLKEKGNK